MSDDDDHKLTGRRRFRTLRKWGHTKLVLQVEYRYWHYSYYDCTPAFAWRDATVSDLTELDGSAHV